MTTRVGDSSREFVIAAQITPSDKKKPRGSEANILEAAVAAVAATLARTSLDATKTPEVVLRKITAGAEPLLAALEALFGDHFERALLPELLVTVTHYAYEDLSERIRKAAQATDKRGGFGCTDIITTIREYGPESVLDQIQRFVEDPWFREDPQAFLNARIQHAGTSRYTGREHFEEYCQRKGFDLPAIAFIENFLANEAKPAVA